MVSIGLKKTDLLTILKSATMTEDLKDFIQKWSSEEEVDQTLRSDLIKHVQNLYDSSIHDEYLDHTLKECIDTDPKGVFEWIEALWFIHNINDDPNEYVENLYSKLYPHENFTFYY